MSKPIYLKRGQRRLPPEIAEHLINAPRGTTRRGQWTRDGRYLVRRIRGSGWMPTGTTKKAVFPASPTWRPK